MTLLMDKSGLLQFLEDSQGFPEHKGFDHFGVSSAS